MIKEKRLLLTGCPPGLGDWLMLQTAMKCMNTLYPNLLIDLNITGVSPWFVELSKCFDHKAFFVKNPNLKHYSNFASYLLWSHPAPRDANQRPIHLIRDMLESIGTRCGIPFTWNGRLAGFTAHFTPFENARPYVVIPSTGKKGHSYKNWSVENFETVASILSRYVDVVQIGVSSDPILPSAKIKAFDLTPAQIHSVISGASSIISLENGISHWAGLIAKPCVTLYTSPGGTFPANAFYRNQIPLCGHQIPADLVAEQTLEILKSLNILSSYFVY